MMHKPSWFIDGSVVISNAQSCGINKDGLEQFVVDSLTGERSGKIDDKLFQDVVKISKGGKRKSESIHIIKSTELNNKRVYVPKYYDYSFEKKFKSLIKKLKGFKERSLGDLIHKKVIAVFHGHGSPSADQRVGDIPYIKVSDIRAGHININPSNLIPQTLAEKFWRGKVSGLKAYDLISPERASKNIGEFAVLMPGQEQIVLTKEVLVIRSLKHNTIDQFYLMWALSLDAVREQWNRIIFMQTNREDVGERFCEIKIPFPDNPKKGVEFSSSFRDYYTALENARTQFEKNLKSSPHKHHFFI